MLYPVGSSETGRGPERPEVRRTGATLAALAGRHLDPLPSFPPGFGASRLLMEPGKDEEAGPQPAGPPSRKKFVIPLDEDEVPPAGAKPLFRSTGSLPTVETSAQVSPQTYAEYAISRPPGGAGATCPTVSEPLAGETPNQALKPGAKSNSIIVSPRQRGNPVLKFVRNVPWEFGEVVPDYVLGQSTCALFLSLRYHNLHPDYIHERLQSLGKTFALRILLVQVDVGLWGPCSCPPEAQASSPLSEEAGVQPSGSHSLAVEHAFFAGHLVSVGLAPARQVARAALTVASVQVSLRYHNLHPDYIHERLQSLGKTFALRILLVQVDVKDPQQALKELAKMCILADCTLILAWSPEEAGRYLETYKAYEQKPADLLMEKLEQDFVSRVTECLTTVKSVNKTDSQTLLATFGSLEQLISASREDLALCPGLGPQKARRLFDVLHEPFLKVPR
ncbi:DNA excision repair protein ERCC-1 [Sciurus carolinensis]|uniref:DNA excision repair protein ERCC-1 n=1 Tax=Sciurus carolinensis TaxID=30640 RepID=A0AA41SZQ7_SCICA|nr:DNA excision repair protein ERCC-1 [Sciurus carolinensis]